MYIRTFVHSNLHLYECTYDECTYESTLIRMYVRIYAYTNVRMNLCLYDCTYESMLTRMHVRIYAYTNVRTNLRLYECMYESTLIQIVPRLSKFSGTGSALENFQWLSLLIPTLHALSNVAAYGSAPANCRFQHEKQPRETIWALRKNLDEDKNVTRVPFSIKVLAACTLHGNLSAQMRSN